MKRTPIDLDKVRELVAAGANDRAIATALGVHKASVKNVRKRHGIRPVVAPNLPRLNPDEVRTLAAEGLKDGEIGRRLGASANGVWECRQRFSIPAAQPKPRLLWSPTAVRELVAKGLTDEQVGVRLGKPAHSVAGYRRRHAIPRRRRHNPADYGLPEWLTPTEVAICVSLAGGAKTVGQIRRDLGLSADSCRGFCQAVREGKRMSLLKALQQDGLIHIAQKRSGGQFKHGEKGKPSLYALTTRATELMADRIEEAVGKDQQPVD